MHIWTIHLAICAAIEEASSHVTHAVSESLYSVEPKLPIQSVSFFWDELEHIKATQHHYSLIASSI